MSIKDTSKECYNEIVKHNKNKLYPKILQALDNRNYTNRELSQELDIITSTLSPRIKELEAMGLVERVNKRKCTITNITAYEISLIKK